MNREILVDDSRILKLKNIISITINLSKLKDPDDLNKKIKNFDDYCKNNALQIVGPLVTETIMIDGDEPKILLKLMRQIIDKFKPTIPYQFEEELKTNVCLYSRFEGNENDSSIAQSKLQVYAYENEYILDTSFYQVHIKKEENYVVIDTFIPILGRG